MQESTRLHTRYTRSWDRLADELLGWRVEGHLQSSNCFISQGHLVFDAISTFQIQYKILYTTKNSADLEAAMETTPLRRIATKSLLIHLRRTTPITFIGGNACS